MKDALKKKVSRLTLITLGSGHMRISLKKQVLQLF